jgi:hypothetical protein
MDPIKVGLRGRASTAGARPRLLRHQGLSVHDEQPNPPKPGAADLSDLLRDLLRDFPYEPGRVRARLVRAKDGREVLQVRVELGILQMECDGRPDGLESAFSAGRSLANAMGAAEGRLEVAQLEQRTVAFLAAGDPVRALRDTESILELLDRLADEAPEAEREWVESARFSVIVLRTRAMAAALVQVGRQREASSAVEQGLRLLRVEAERIGIGDQFDALGDVRALRTLRESLVPQLPPAERSELEARLEAAVRTENYKLAAILRDELRRL